MDMTILAVAAALLVLPPARFGDVPGPRMGAGAPAAQITQHVVTVLVPRLEDDSARAAVVRRPRHPGNLILITAETTPQEYLDAMRALNRSRREEGEAPGAELRAFVRRAGSRDVRDQTALARAAEHLSRVMAAPERSIEGVGSYPALTTSLPPLRR